MLTVFHWEVVELTLASAASLQAARAQRDGEDDHTVGGLQDAASAHLARVGQIHHQRRMMDLLRNNPSYQRAAAHAVKRKYGIADGIAVLPWGPDWRDIAPVVCKL